MHTPRAPLRWPLEAVRGPELSVLPNLNLELLRTHLLQSKMGPGVMPL